MVVKKKKHSGVDNDLENVFTMTKEEEAHQATNTPSNRNTKEQAHQGAL